MKKILFVLIMALSFSYSQTSGMGVGLVINNDFGISGKYWVDRTNAIDLIVNLGNTTVIGADYVWHKYDLINSQFPVYYGVGASVALGNGNGFAVNGVTGIDFLIKKIKVDVFLELVPTIAISPSSGFDMGWNLGGRYFF
jgi:hypothetical protein